MRAAAVFIALAAAVAPIAVALAAWELSRVGVHQGYAPIQPIAFSHKLHAGDYQVSCMYCHWGARTSRHAGIPSLNVCMNCHGLLTRQTTDIERLKEAVQQGRAIAWTRVHNLPDFVYFNHSQHAIGGVACQDCHGPVQTMERVRQDKALTMGWCIACHRARGPELQLARQATLGRGDPHAPFPGLDCGKCHF